MQEFDTRLGNSLVFHYNVNANGEYTTVKIDETKQISPLHYTIQLSQNPDDSKVFKVIDKNKNELHRVYNMDEINAESYYLNAEKGQVYFDCSKGAENVIISYDGQGYELIGASRVYDETDCIGNTIKQTLQDIINKGRDYIKAIELLGGAIPVITRLENDIADGMELYANLENDIEVAVPLQANLHKDIQDTNTFRIQFNKDVADGKELYSKLHSDIAECKALDTTLNMSMNNAKENINLIRSAGNPHFEILASDWISNTDTSSTLGYMKDITHNLETQNIIINAFDITTGMEIFPNVRRINNNTLRFFNDNNTDGIKVILSARYYDGGSDIGDEVKSARKTFETIGKRFDNIDSQLAESNTYFHNNSINIKMPFHGLTPAKGDYIDSVTLGTDDTTAIQTIIDYANTNNLSVYIPRGNYRVDGGLILRKGTVIYSDRATLFYNNSTGACINSVGNSVNDYISPRVKGLIVKSVPYNQTGIGIYLESTVFAVFEDCDFFGFEYGIKHSVDVTNKWAYLNTFTRCRVTDNNYGIKLDAQSNGVNVDKCYIFGNKLCGVHLVRAISSRITNGEIEANGNNVPGGHGIVVEGGASNLISGNYMELNGYNDENSASILVDKTTLASAFTPQNVGTRIVNNQISPSGRHTIIKVNDARAITITGNSFYETLPPMYDIDIFEMINLDDSVITGNAPSLNGIIKMKPNLGTSTIQHGITSVPNLTSLIPILSNYTNIIINGGFENDLTNWTIDNGVSLDTTIKKKGLKSAKVVSVTGATYAKQPVSTTIGNKYYVVGSSYIVKASTNMVIMQFAGQNIMFNSGILNQWQKKSTIITPSTGTSSTLYVGKSNGDTEVYFDEIMIVDLTDLFGVGNEPTLAWCDANLLSK